MHLLISDKAFKDQRIAGTGGLLAAFGRPTFGDNRGMQSGADGVRKGVNLVVAIDFDGLLGGIADNVAVAAPHQMFFEIRLQGLIDCAVQICRQLF